jgi:transposase-like protein
MSVSDLCREFGVSRQTGYRWINRYKEVGPEGLLNRSSKPNGCSRTTTEAIENEIFALRSKHPSWGARKLKARLEMLDPEVNCLPQAPSATFSDEPASPVQRGRSGAQRPTLNHSRKSQPRISSGAWTSARHVGEEDEMS